MRTEGRMEGMNEWLESTDDGIRALEQAAKTALMQTQLHLLGQAVELAPVDTGKLRASGTISIDGKEMASTNEAGGVLSQGIKRSSGTRQSNLIHAEVGFYTDYAMEVHEDLSARHEVGQAKFLETPHLQNQELYMRKFTEIAEESLEQAFRSRGGGSP